MPRFGQRLYYTADRSRVVKEGDAAAAFLAYGPDDDVPQEVADALELEEAPAEEAAEDEEETDADEDDDEADRKQVPAPPEDKAQPAPRPARREAPR